MTKNQLDLEAMIKDIKTSAYVPNFYSDGEVTVAFVWENQPISLEMETHCLVEEVHNLADDYGIDLLDNDEETDFLAYEWFQASASKKLTNYVKNLINAENDETGQALLNGIVEATVAEYCS